jgi:hypothetical protein
MQQYVNFCKGFVMQDFLLHLSGRRIGAAARAADRGSSPKIIASAPVRQMRRPLEGSNRGLVAAGETARMPLSPSTITARAPRSVAPTRAMRASFRLSAIERTHSAPARVLPKPRPPMISQVRQSPSGGS